MTRIVNNANAVELAKASCISVTLFYFDFASGAIYLCDGLNDVVYNGNTYASLGEVGNIGGVEEELTTLARPLTITASGCDQALINIARTQVYQNREVILYLGWLDQATLKLVANPEVWWEGRMDYMTLAIEQGKGTITLNCEHRLRREPRYARYTDADQQGLYPGDTAFSFTKDVAGFVSGWGDNKVGYSGPSTTYTPGRSPVPGKYYGPG